MMYFLHFTCVRVESAQFTIEMSQGLTNSVLFYKTNRLSHDLDTKLCLLSSLSRSPLADLTHVTSPLDVSFRLLFRSLAGVRRICLTIPTNNSSTLWLITADTSMYLQSYCMQIDLASEIQMEKKLMMLLLNDKLKSDCGNLIE